MRFPFEDVRESLGKEEGEAGGDVCNEGVEGANEKKEK